MTDPQPLSEQMRAALEQFTQQDLREPLQPDLGADARFERLDAMPRIDTKLRKPFSDYVPDNVKIYAGFMQPFRGGPIEPESFSALRISFFDGPVRER